VVSNQLANFSLQECFTKFNSLAKLDYLRNQSFERLISKNSLMALLYQLSVKSVLRCGHYGEVEIKIGAETMRSSSLELDNESVLSTLCFNLETIKHAESTMPGCFQTRCCRCRRCHSLLLVRHDQAIARCSFCRQITPGFFSSSHNGAFKLAAQHFVCVLLFHEEKPAPEKITRAR
jgi:hypothetical protein